MVGRELITGIQKQRSMSGLSTDPGRNYIRPPPPPPDFGQKAFLREREGGCIFRTPRSRNFIRPPSFIRPPPLEGYFHGWGVGVYKIWPCNRETTGEIFPNLVWIWGLWGRKGCKTSLRNKTCIFRGWFLEPLHGLVGVFNSLSQY